ncbi:MAG: response regulator transcription factor [Nitrospira sp.]|nr:response regulator transcription factor [Nitrospira sp.]
MIGTNIATSPLRIAIVSRQPLVCLGLQKLFEHEEVLRIVVQPHQRMTPDLLQAAHRPDLFILDLETEHDAVGTIKEIRKLAPNSKVVLLSGIEDRQRLYEAFACGVDGIILKIQPPAVMLAMVEALYAPVKNCGQAVQHEGEELQAMPKQKVEYEAPLPVWPDVVTQREREVISLVRQGLSNKEIAHRLCITDSTVRHHLTNIFDKVGVSNRQKLLVHTHQFCSVPVSLP